MENACRDRIFASVNRLVRKHAGILSLMLIIIVLGPTTLKAQTYLESVGVPPFTAQSPIENGFINLANGDLHIEIPLGSFPQRGGREDKIAIVYDSAIWEGADGYWGPDNVPPSGASEPFLGAAGYTNDGGWRLVTSGDTGSTNYGYSEGGNCSIDYDFRTSYYGPFIWSEPNGTGHSFNVNTIQPNYPTDCPISNDTPNGTAYASDGTGYYLSVTNYTIGVVYAPDGTVTFDGDFTDRFGYAEVGVSFPKDSNGNYYIQAPSAEGANITDTLGRNPVTAVIGTNTVTLQVLNSQGGRSNYTVNIETIPVHTNFYGGVGGDYNGNMGVVQSIQLPDGTSYSFTYDQGTDAGHYGVLTSMTLPTGGQINYSYVGYNDPYGRIYRWVSGRSTPDGMWSYSPQALQSPCATGQTYYVNCNTQVTVTKPSGDQTVYTFTIDHIYGAPWPTQVQYYNGSVSSSNLLATTLQCFNFVTVTSGSCSYPVTTGTYLAATNVHLLASTTTLPVAGSTTTEYSWDNGNQGLYGQEIQRSEWNFGHSPAYAPDRTTCITYASPGANIVNRPSSVTVVNNWSSTPCSSIPSQDIMAQTLYTYDVYTYNGGTLSSVTGLPGHDDTNYGTNNTGRGNVTLTQKLVGGSTYLNSNNNLDTTGQVTFAYDPGNQKTSYAYGCQNAYPTIIANPLSQPTTLGYDCTTGLLTSIKDPNNQTTSFNYDSMGRPLTTGYPDAGQTTLSYSYNGNTYAGRTTTKKVTSSQNLITTANTDGLGRVTSSVTTSDPDGQTTVSTVYDSDGRVLKTSNPYHSTSDQTYGWEINAYDGMDRVIQTTHADGHISSIYYGASVAAQGGAASQQLCSTSSYGVGYPVLKIDEAGNKLQSWTDAFGRIIEADEPTATSGNLTANTCYAYDLNNNLTGVLAAGGIQTRNFVYDDLSRLTKAINPEIGGTATPTVYNYDADGSCAAPNSFPGDLVSRVDARGIRTCMQYDALHRLTLRNYSDGITPTDYFVYDVSSHWGIPLSNTVGRLTEEYTDTTKPWSASILGYDPMGRVMLNNQCTPASCGTSNSSISYTYDYLGDMATYTNGAGVTITQAPFSGAGHLTQVTSSLSDSNHPGTLVTNVHYNALGETISATLGNGAVESLGYAPRGWPLTASVASQSTGTPGTGSVTINGAEQSHTQNGYSSSQGPNTATSLADHGGGSLAWTISGTGAYTGYATSNINTDYLDVSNLGFNIPTNATITGIYVDVSDYAVSRNDDSGICDNVIQLIRGGVAQGANKAWTCWTYPDLPPDDTYYGSSTDTWGLSLSGADVDASNFGLRVQGYSYIYTYNVKAGVDFVTITVYYTVPPVTTYDSGTASVTINSQTVTASYNNGSTGASIASSLASSISALGFVTASTGGTNVISITSTTHGSNTNYSLSGSSTTNYPQYFNPPSFTTSPSGSNLTGGTGAPGTLYSFSLGYGSGNSNVTSANDSVNGNWVFTYDYLNRLSTSNQNNNQNACSYGYDQLGNRTSQTATAGSCGNLSLSYSGNNNRMDGYSYDAAGNLLSDGVHSYFYDAENRIIQVDGMLGTWPNNCSTATACYNYDAEGRRIQKTTGAGKVEYLHDLNGNIVSDLSSTGGWNRGEVFANGQHLATYAGGTTGTTYFDHSDWLGTERARSSMADANCETITNLPFGDGQSVSGTCADVSPLHFTGQQRDSEISVTSLDYFNARHYSSQFGRFMSPDPLGNVVPDPTNPQTWNQYAYVVNNPLTFIDPSGQEYCRTADWTGDDPNTGGAAGGGLICDVTDDQYNQNPFTYGALNYQYNDVTGGVEQNPSECPGCGITVFDSILLSEQQDQIAAQKLKILAQLNQVPTDQDRIEAVRKGMGVVAKALPAPCGGGVSMFVGAQGKKADPSDPRAFLGAEVGYDLKSGFFTHGVVEAGDSGAGLSGGRGYAMIQTGPGGIIASEDGTIGGYVGGETGNGRIGYGAAAYTRLTSVAGCKE